MKTLSVTSSMPANIKLPVALIFWKIAKNGILAEFLGGSQAALNAKILFNINDEQLEEIRATKHVSDDVCGKIFELCQQKRELAGMVVEAVAQSMLSRNAEICEKGERWQIMLGLIAACHMAGISRGWLEDGTIIQEMLENEDVQTLDKCRCALNYICAYMDLKYFKEKELPSFLDSYRAAIMDMGQDCGSYEEFVNSQKSLANIQKIKRKFAGALRDLRKNVHDMAKNQKIVSVRMTDFAASNIWEFAAFINANIDSILTGFMEAAENSLPVPMDMESLKELLGGIEPPVPTQDMQQALAEMEDIKNGILERRASQLLTNVIPALKGEKDFDIKAFDEAEDNGLVYTYSYKFIKKLLAKGFHAPEIARGTRAAVPETCADNSPENARFHKVGEDNVPPQDWPDKNAADASPEEIPAPVQAWGEETAARNNSFAESQEIASGIRAAPEAATVESGETGAVALFAEENAALAPDAQAESEERGEEIAADEGNGADPFDFYEGILDNAIPDNGGFSAPQAGNMEKDKGTAENPDMPVATCADGDIKEPSERKFASQQAQASEELNLPRETAFSPEKPAEKKSPASGVESYSGKSGEDTEKSFTAFINSLENISPDESSAFPVNPDWSRVFQEILKRSDLAGLVWLARSLGDNSPYPAWLVELLYLGSQLLSQGKISSPAIADLSAQAAESLGKLDDKGSLLLAAAILRPAVLMPDRNMGAIASFLASRLSAYALGPFFRDLEGFIRRGHAVEAGIFTGESQSVLPEGKDKLKQDMHGEAYQEKAFCDLFAALPEDISILEESAEGKILASQLKNFKSCLRNRLPAPDLDPEEELRNWPLRSPLLRLGQKNSPEILAREILSGNTADDSYVAASLVFHAAGGEIEACSGFLRRHAALAEMEPNLDLYPAFGFAARGKKVAEFKDIASSIWARKFQEEYEKVRSIISDCEFRGALPGRDIPEFLNELGGIFEKYRDSGDKAQGVRELRQIREKLAAMEK